MWSEWTRIKNGILNFIFFYSIFDDINFHIHPSCHLNTSAKANFSISLRKVNISHRNQSTFDVHWQIHFRTNRQVFNITISSMLSWRNCSCSFSFHFLSCFSLQFPNPSSFLIGQLCQRRNSVWMGFHKFGLSIVPLL